MRYRFYYGNRPTFTQKDLQDFDRGNYKCVALMNTRAGNLVVISQSKDPVFPVWKVEYDYSTVVFGSYAEAMAYCKGRFHSAERRS